MTVDETMRVLEALHRFRVEYVLVGGVALNLLGIVRATEDIDLFVRPTPDNIERLKEALRSLWADSSIDEISAEELMGEYPAIRYHPPEGRVYLDVLTRLGTAVSFEDLEWEEIEIEGVSIRLATPKVLYRLKRDTVRPIDRADAEALKRLYGIEDD